MPIRVFAVAILLAVLGVTGTARAQEVEGWNDFDCQEMIEWIQSPSLQTDSNVTLELVVPPGSDIPAGDDPINVEEILGDQEPLLIRSRSAIPSPRAGDAYNLICVLIVIEFYDNSSRETLGIQEKGTHTPWERIPVLLVSSASQISEANLNFSEWHQDNYDIPVEFSSFNGENTMKITPDVVLDIDFLKRGAWDYSTVRFLRTHSLPENVKRFLEDSEASDARAMMVLCEAYPCHEFADSVRTAASQEPPPPAVPETDAPATPACEPEPPGTVGTCRVVTLAYSGAREESTANLDVVGDLACILSAIDPDIFETLPACDTTSQGHRAREELAGLNPVIQIAPDGRWLIVAGTTNGDPGAEPEPEPEPEPVQVVVTLPEGQPEEGCQLDIKYEAADGRSVTVPLEPQNDGILTRFVASIENPIRRDGDGVRLTIVVKSSESQCGGSTREDLFPASEVIEIDLVPGDRVLNAVAHILPINSNSLEIDLDFSDADRLDFVRAVFGALEAAHVRLQAAHADRVWPLVSATVSRLKGDGELEELVSLNGWSLRRPDTEGFDGIEGEFGTLMDNQATLTRLSLASALQPLVREREDQGIDRLTVTLIAPIAPRPEGRQLADACSDPRYHSLAAELATSNGPDVEVVVFPLVRLHDDDQPDLSHLVPLSLDPAAPTLPGGLYACRDTPPDMAIYPFFVEPWRTPVEIAPRYATALSDQLAAVLATLLTEGEPIR